MKEMAVPDLRSNYYYMSKLSASTQSSVRPNYEELVRSYIPPTGDHNFTDHQQRLYYRQPYTVAINSLNPPAQFPSHHQTIHEPILPKFPPQMFDIPDIHDSNSVFNEGTFEVNSRGGASKTAPYHLPFEPQQPPVCRTMMSSFPGEWRPPSYISVAAAAAAGSTDSSPLTHNEENNSYVDVPLLQPLNQQQNVFSSSATKTPIKKAKSPKKRKRKDPNEPQKPVSAYSLFFRNAQAAIKSQNPNATFGDISKIVASMWDNLDNEIKRFYKRQMEIAKKEYLKQLAVYRANLSTQQESEGRCASSKEESDQSQQPTMSAKMSPSSSSSSSSGPSSVSSSLLAGHAEESVSQRPLASELQVQDHAAVQHQRPRSVEASVHKLPISQHAMSQQQQQQQQQQPPPVYFKELGPGGGPPPLQNVAYGVPANITQAMAQNMFHSYNNTERPDYFGSGIGIPQNHYIDNRYAAAGMWNHSLQTDDYTPKCLSWTQWPK